MKAIILCAGEWSRLRPLTKHKPKSLTKIFWKSILEHNVEMLWTHCEEIIVIAKYKSEKIIEEVNKLNKIYTVNIKVKLQWDKPWTAAAIMDLDISWDFILINWDTIFTEEDIKNIINLENYWVLVKEVENPEKFWIFRQEKNSNLALEIIEKPEEFVWNLANLWVYKFNQKIIEFCNKIELSKRKEYEITDAINLFIKEEKFELIKAKNDFIDITYSWDILDANNKFLDLLTASEIEWEIEEWTTIKWRIILWKNSIIKAGTYIEWNVIIWENSVVWPNAYIRWGTAIWNNCKIWNTVEIKNSHIWDNTNVAHLSYVWDSILWDNVNIWWGLITANLRHDKESIKAIVKGNLINTWRRKLWVIIWDNVKVWIHNSAYPGRIIEADSFTVPREIIK
jgi:bifunctional UDP-N-acetylglucosamine pyrophosphorylase/glucosamine-1-phosphate N-acetyltransferase